MRRIANNPGLNPDCAAPGVNFHPRTLPEWLPANRSVLFACARHGLYHGWRALRLPPGSAILLPAFICNTVTQPLRLAGARFVFFGVNDDLSPDLNHAADAAARAKRSGVRVRALLWYNYLGFTFGMAAAQSFCRERRLILLEDCAHTLPGCGSHAAGSLGDLAVFSIRKVLPVTNAGALVINNRKFLPISEPKWRSMDGAYTRILHDKELASRRLFEERGHALHASRLRHVAYVTRLNSPQKKVREATRIHIYDHDLPLRRMAQPVNVDDLSLHIIHHANLSAVSSARQRNYRVYTQRIGELALFPHLGTGVTPLGFSIRVPDRDQFRLRLAQRGVESTTHWPDWLLPPGTRRGFPVVRRLADQLLTLPCHQGLSTDDIEFACRAVAKSWRK